jgi:ferredoxin
MLDELRERCRRLLADGQVKVVIGYGQSAPDRPAYPVFVTRAEDVDRLVWNERCPANLTVYLSHKDVRALGKPAIVVKGCDARTLVVLEKENQIDRANMVAIGVACAGVGEPRAAKCAACDVHMPLHTDIVIGATPQETVSSEQRYADLKELLAMAPAERMAFWRKELDRCVKCYACRQICPLCYCERCLADKNRPTCIDTSATPKGNFAWHITRAFHQAARCVGCDECTRACPAGINLRLLNLSLARAAEEHFQYRPGMDRAAEPAVGSFSQQDKEQFIG